ncbi:MAG: hypothetical protein NWS01_04550 [Burkholderiales bacterium]|jgi:hypothetical protein|nr:hypothetical protein [Burkholderiales bacterium]MDP4909013.1 hypothetical protein [Burkholderiaceae bacterium]
MTNTFNTNKPALEIGTATDELLSTTSPANIEEFDIASLRIPSNFGASLGVKKILNLVPVGKPTATQFFRTHPSANMRFDTMLLASKGTQETYLMSQQVAGQLSELIKPVTLVLVIDRQSNLRLVPVPFPGPDGQRNPWHQSLLDALTLAETSWIRISANMSGGGYDVFQALGQLPDPEWPNHTMDEIIKIAFRGRIINDLEHPVVQSLFGTV